MEVKKSLAHDMNKQNTQYIYINISTANTVVFLLFACLAMPAYGRHLRSHFSEKNESVAVASRKRYGGCLWLANVAVEEHLKKMLRSQNQRKKMPNRCRRT